MGGTVVLRFCRLVTGPARFRWVEMGTKEGASESEMKSQIHEGESAIRRMRASELPRPRIMTCLSEIPDFPVTVVKAGAGYGKTTAVSNYVRQSGLGVRWLTIREGDRHGIRFVQRLMHSLLPEPVINSSMERILVAADSPLTWLLSAELSAEFVVNYVHEDLVVVLDDFHLLDDDATVLQWMDRWLGHLPLSMHVVLVTRTSPGLLYVEALDLRGEVLRIRERELAFTEEELGFLFRMGAEPMSRGPALERKQVHWLLQRTGGMAMVLSILLRFWRQHGSFDALQAALDEQTSLTEQVGRLFLRDLTPEQQAFLRDTCLFSPLQRELCDAALGRMDSQKILAQLERKGYIAAVEEGQGYELHPMVRDYLAASLAPHERDPMLERAIVWHLERGEELRAILYVFQHSDEAQIASTLYAYIPSYLNRGQVSTVQGWLDRLSVFVLESSSELLFAKAEVARHSNRYEESIHFYNQARARATANRRSPGGEKAAMQIAVQVEIGLARLYLDTIQPAPAVLHIRQARRLVARDDTASRYSLLQLEFENAINHGRVVRAQRLSHVFTTLDGPCLPKNNSDARLLLRMGHVHKVIKTLVPRISVDPLDGRTALSHREATLLIALMYAMAGEGEKAKEHAERGYRVGNSLQSPFVSAVGYIRLGHAQHLLNPLGDEALTSYQEAVLRMDEMQLPRGKSEALMGLCLAHGFRRQFGLAKLYAQEAMAIAETAGDRWMASLVRLAFGQVAVVNELYDTAIEVLTTCADTFSQCGDEFLASASRLWRALAWFQVGDRRAHSDLAHVLVTAERYDCMFLLERETFCGLRDMQALVPLLQAHRTHGSEPRRALQVLHRLNAEALDYHPGYTVRVQTFGSFAVWRGFTPVVRREWHREKARQLFQFLIANRGNMLHREEICERLWGDADPATAERDFKVALNALSSVLEPTKPGRGTSVFVTRHGALYGLTAHPMLVVDKDLFLQRLREAGVEQNEERRRHFLAGALKLYAGDFLTEVRYEAWCDSERDRLHMHFVNAATEFAELSYNSHRFADVLQVCDWIIAMEPTWEDAYVWLMRVYAAQYNRPMVLQTYRVCERMLQEQLGIPPMESTRKVYEAALGRDARH